jgi:hypothetical protein
LGQGHRESNRRRRETSVTVNEKMPLIAGTCQNISSEGQELTNMLRFGRVHAQLLLYNIVEAQLQPLILGK